MAAKPKFYWKKTCSTCRNSKAFLQAENVDVEEIDLAKGLSVEELESIIGKEDYRRFLNTRNELYRDRKMSTNPPSRDEALRLMSENPNLIRRPLLVKGRKAVAGFDPDAMRHLLASEAERSASR